MGRMGRWGDGGFCTPLYISLGSVNQFDSGKERDRNLSKDRFREILRLSRYNDCSRNDRNYL